MTGEAILLLLIVAAAGGAFGAATGALPAFAFAGIAVIAGEVVVLTGGPPTITSHIGFGPVLGPHVAFGGGAAAAAYVGRDESFAPDFEYHQAKAITVGFGARPDALLVGAGFGVLGAGATLALRAAGAPLDPVAAGVVVSAIAHRAVLGYDVIGAPADGWFDMTPFERGERRTAATDPRGGVATDGHDAFERLAVEPWLPYQYQWGGVALLGVAMGALGGYVAYRTGSPFLAFGLSAALLLFLCADVDGIPVTHHMTLPASTAVIALAGAGARAPDAVTGIDPLVAVSVGAAFGGLGAVVGEGLQRVAYAHADTHLDPPAASIVVTSFLIATLAAIGLFPGSAWVPLP